MKAALLRSLVLLGAFSILEVNLGSASAQDRTVKIGNGMKATVDVVLTPVGGSPLPALAIGEDGTVDFRFTGQRFDIQVIPRDDPDSGFRFPNVDLNDLAGAASDGVIRLGGEFEGGMATQWYCCETRRRFRRSCCVWYSVEVPQGKRIGVTLEGRKSDGTAFALRSPKMTYEDLQKPFR